MNAEINDTLVEIEIDAPKDIVWDAMINKMAAWWAKDCLALEGAAEMKFEPWAGGRQWVENEKGEQILWGTVIGIMPGRSVDIAGHTMPEWGGPALWLWKMEVIECGAGTKFRLSNSKLGKAGDVQSSQDGWQTIFEGLKTYCES